MTSRSTSISYYWACWGCWHIRQIHSLSDRRACYCAYESYIYVMLSTHGFPWVLVVIMTARYHIGTASVYSVIKLFVLTLKVLNFWKFTSYYSLKPLWSGMGEVVPARTSPTLHPPSPPTVHQLSWLALFVLTQHGTEQRWQIPWGQNEHIANIHKDDYLCMLKTHLGSVSTGSDRWVSTQAGWLYFGDRCMQMDV